MKNIARQLFRFFSSYGLACVLFVLLLLLTYLGTLYQTTNGLYQAQEKYFNSLFLVHWAFGQIPVPLPGGLLLSGLVFVNLICGGILRARKGWSHAGVLVAHLGICLLLVGSFVSYQYAQFGHMTLYEGESASHFESYDEWELTLTPATSSGQTATQCAYPLHGIPGGGPQGKTAHFQAGALPVTVELWGYAKNAAPQPVSKGQPSVDGYLLQALPLEKESEMNVPGLYIRLRGATSGALAEGIAWGGARSPLTLTVDDQSYVVEVNRRRFPLSFTVTLNKFTRTLYPGTQMPKEFKSEVTRTEGGVTQSVLISMNEPMRHLGYTFYQSSWGPSNAPEGARLYSVFAVVRNPVDQVPLYSCIIIALGMTFHFLRGLLVYLRREARHAASAATLLLVLGLAATAQAQEQATPVDFAAVADQLATLPVQEQGRIKPLQTIANVSLLKFNGKRSAVLPNGHKADAVEWLAWCLFAPEEAKHFKTFQIDNADVMVALGLPFEKKRDRYSYEDLAPSRTKLSQLAQQYSAIPEQSRDTAQTQLINLAHNVNEFELYTHYFNFARLAVSIEGSPELQTMFPGKSTIGLADLLSQSTAISQAVRASNPKKGEKSGMSPLLPLFDAAQDALILRLIPPAPGSTEVEWASPAGMLEEVFSEGRPVAEERLALLRQLEQLAQAARSGDAAFSAALGEFHQSLTSQATQRGEYGKIPLEVKFYKAQFFYYSLIVYVLAFLLMAFSWLRLNSRLVYRLTFASTLGATLLLAAGITLRCIIRERPPVTTLYETILFSTLVAAGVALFMEFINRRRVGLFLSTTLGALGLFLANKYEIREGADTMPSMIAVLDTNFWLATHVTTITIGYGASFLASAIAHAYVLGRVFRIRTQDTAFYRHLGRMVIGVISFALLFSLIGTILGGIWANESWGRFWGWDPKENGALMIVLWQLAMLHALRGQYVADFGFSMAAIFCGIVVAFSWFGVNLLGVGLHSYGFTSGIFRALVTFYAVEAVVLAMGFCAWLWEDWLNMRTASALKGNNSRRAKARK